MLSLASHIRLRATLRPPGCNSKTIPSVFLGIYELLILFCGAKIAKKRQINKYMPLFYAVQKPTDGVRPTETLYRLIVWSYN